MSRKSGPRSAMIECEHCGNYNRGQIEIDECGASVAIETAKCGIPWCGKRLCPGCESFGCDDCGRTFCTSHQCRTGEYVRCIVCEAGRFAVEPDCTCVRADADFDDVTHCDLCNPGSAWNLARAAAEEAIAPEPVSMAAHDPYNGGDPFADLVPVRVMEMDLASRLRASLRGAA